MFDRCPREERGASERVLVGGEGEVEGPHRGW